MIVGGKVLPTDFSLDFHGHTEQEALDRLSALSHIAEMLRTLRISKDLNLGDLSDKDLQGLNYLVSGIVDHRPVPFNINGKAEVEKLTVGNLTILLATKNNPDGDGFLLSNFFSVDDLVLTADKMRLEDGCNISPYLLLTADTFDTIDNFHLSEIVLSIRKFRYTMKLSGIPSQYQLAANILLESF